MGNYIDGLVQDCSNSSVLAMVLSQYCRDIFCLKNFHTLTRTPVRVLKTNAVACAQLIFEMLTLLQKYLY